MTNTRHLRPQIEDGQINMAMAATKTAIAACLAHKGRGSFLSSHEILGALAEEFDELKDAVREDDLKQIAKELLDIAGGAVFALACVNAETMHWPEQSP